MAPVLQERVRGGPSAQRERVGGERQGDDLGRDRGDGGYGRLQPARAGERARGVRENRDERRDAMKILVVLAISWCRF